MKTAAAAVATSQFPILGANDRINVGVVGIGGRGRAHINFYSELDEDCQVAAICDVNQAARERGEAQVRKLKNFTPKSFVNLREMFESKDVDAFNLDRKKHELEMKKHEFKRKRKEMKHEFKHKLKMKKHELEKEKLKREKMASKIKFAEDQGMMQQANKLKRKLQTMLES